MAEKTLIIKLLDKLIPYWTESQQLIDLIQNDYLNNKEMDYIILELTKQCSIAKSNKEKEILNKSILIASKIKKLEENQRQIDQKDVENIEKLLLNI